MKTWFRFGLLHFSVIDPLVEHHLSETGMRGRLRQCRIGAGGASDAAAPRSHTWLQREATKTTLSTHTDRAQSRSCARTHQVRSKNKYSFLDEEVSTSGEKSKKKWSCGQVNPSTGALGEGRSSDTDRRTTFRRAPVLRSCPPPSAVTSARRSFLRDGKTYVTLL